MQGTHAQVTLVFGWLAFAVKLVWCAVLPGILRVPNNLLFGAVRGLELASYPGLLTAGVRRLAVRRPGYEASFEPRS